jgi:hypothetical protein
LKILRDQVYLDIDLLTTQASTWNYFILSNKKAKFWV